MTDKKRQPGITLNSDRVEQISPAEDNLVDISHNSKFAQWRRYRNERGAEVESDNEELEVSEPLVLRPGIEKRVRWKRWGYALLGVLLASAVFVVAVFFSPLLATRTITVEGASLLDAGYVEEKLAPLEGVPMTRISESEVTDLIGNQDILYGVSLEAKPPHELVVKLHERVPVAVVKDKDAFILVDDKGAQLGRATSVEEAGVPLVAGGVEVLGSPAFFTVTDVLAALPTSILSQVAEAKADSASTITLEMADGNKVIWGTSENSELKAKVLVQLMQSVGVEGVTSTYDVSSPLVPTVG
ncbi:MAG: cell division protein FtsQ/DivIB [Rothia sp. (in: high G+C Gram-positive bacteria)]|nr:cell division protein FtsQ/DivIB [Rothia sp. (in: high G+C Gram-positive bacteria)]